MKSVSIVIALPTVVYTWSMQPSGEAVEATNHPSGAGMDVKRQTKWWWFTARRHQYTPVRWMLLRVCCSMSIRSQNAKGRRFRFFPPFWNKYFIELQLKRTMASCIGFWACRSEVQSPSDFISLFKFCNNENVEKKMERPDRNLDRNEANEKPHSFWKSPNHTRDGRWVWYFLHSISFPLFLFLFSINIFIFQPFLLFSLR